MKDLFVNLSKNPVLNQAQFETVLATIKCILPTAYLEFMREHNGGDGFLKKDGWYVNFWPLEELNESNEGYEVPQYAPELFLLASDGGGNAFGIRRREQTFIRVNLIDLSNEDATNVGSDFAEFIEFLANGTEIED